MLLEKTSRFKQSIAELPAIKLYNELYNTCTDGVPSETHSVPGCNRPIPISTCCRLGGATHNSPSTYLIAVRQVTPMRQVKCHDPLMRF